MALLKIIKLNTKTWKHNSNIDGDFILTKFYAKTENNDFLLVESYGSKRRKYKINEIEVYDIGGSAETFTNFEDLFLRLEELNYPAFYVDGEFIFNPSNYDLEDFTNESLNLFVREDELNFLSNNPTTYPTATTPISDTDQLFVIQGGVVKKVDKSEIGGAGGLVFFKSFLNVSPTTVTTNGVHTYVFSIPIPAGTIKTGDVVEIRYSVAKTSGGSSVNANAWLSNSAGAMTQIIQTGILAGSPSNSKNLYKRSLIFESNTRFFSVISSTESNYSDEVQTAGARAFTDMSVNLTNDLYLDFSVKNFGAGNYVFIDFAYIKVFRNT